MADTDSALQHPPPINTVDMPLEPLPEGIYGFVMASLIKDSADMKVHGALRPLRIFSAFTLFSLMFILQMFLIIQTKRLVTPGQVANAREVYGMFEATMYTDDSGVQHTWNTSFGYPRGHDGFFNEKNFAKLGREEQRTVCRIPLSQPWFLFSVLFIWALTCLHHVRRSVNLALRFVAIPTIDRHDITVSELRSMADGSGDEVVGLPCWLKVALIVFVQSPRVLMSFFLDVVGCPVAYSDFGLRRGLVEWIGLGVYSELVRDSLQRHCALSQPAVGSETFYTPCEQGGARKLPHHVWNDRGSGRCCHNGSLVHDNFPASATELQVGCQ